MTGFKALGIWSFMFLDVNHGVHSMTAIWQTLHAAGLVSSGWSLLPASFTAGPDLGL